MILRVEYCRPRRHDREKKVFSAPKRNPVEAPIDMRLLTTLSRWVCEILGLDQAPRYSAGKTIERTLRCPAIVMITNLIFTGSWLVHGMLALYGLDNFCQKLELTKRIIIPVSLLVVNWLQVLAEGGENSSQYLGWLLCEVGSNLLWRNYSVAISWIGVWTYLLCVSSAVLQTLTLVVIVGGG